MNSYINTNSPTPLYFQIKEMLKEKIESKEYQEGERIPSENELSDILDVSKPTIRKAMEELANEGYVRKLRGKGTFVTGTKIDQGFIGNLEGYSEEMKRRNIVLASKVLEKEILKADHKLSAKLNLNTGEEIVKLKRLRFIQGEPFIITSSYIPYNKVVNIMAYDFNNTSLYNILENEYGYIIEKGVRSFEPRLVNKEEAGLLDMAEHEPVQYIESITYINTGEPIEYIEAVVKGSRSRFTVELVRKRVI